MSKNSGRRQRRPPRLINTWAVFLMVAYMLFLFSSYLYCYQYQDTRAHEGLADLDSHPPTLTGIPPLSLDEKDKDRSIISITSVEYYNGKAHQNDSAALAIESITVGDKEEVIRLSPPLKADEGLSIQLDDELLVHIGGYIDDYNNVTSSIQFFNITSQSWMNKAADVYLPPEIAETHLGIAFDGTTRMLYVISGQKGPACSPATAASARIHIDTGRHQKLPPLPRARYAPGVEVVVAGVHQRYLHVFGGASEARNERATNHWRLVMDDEDAMSSSDIEKLAWEELEPVPDGGTHGGTFQHDGYIYSTAFCSMDQRRLDSMKMATCQKHAVKAMKQLIHHSVDAGFTFRYPAIGQSDDPHWERRADMPFPVCHSSGIYRLGRYILLGGGWGLRQTKQGSLPGQEYKVQMYDPETNTWDARPHTAPKGFEAMFKAKWYDASRKRAFGIRPGRSALMVQFSASLMNEPAPEKHIKGDFSKQRISYLQQTRRNTMIPVVTRCIEMEGRREITFFTSIAKEYDEVRGTWNKRIYGQQFPDVVTFPNNTDQVSSIVKCARRTGYRVCGRNGKHSFEGDTCTYGIVIDVKRFTSFIVLDRNRGTVRVGAGMFLGRMAVELAPYNLTLPMGHCASVGVTGLVLVGGQGLLSRAYGLTSDFVESIELVDDNGNVINATRSNEYSDYLWLARGGGSSVLHFPGIITSIQFANIPSIDTSKPMWTVVKWNYNASVDNAEKLLVRWQDFYLDEANIADPLFAKLTVEPWLWLQRMQKNAFRRDLHLVAYLYGSDQEHGEFVNRFMPKIEGFLEANDMILQPTRYDDLAFHRMLGGVRDNEELASGVHGWDLKELPRGRQMNRWKGYSAVASHKVPAQAFRTLAESIYYAEPYSRRYVEFKPLGGAMSNLEQRETAFWHRNAIWWSLSSHWFMSRHSSRFVHNSLQSSRAGHERYTSAMQSAYQGGYAGYIDHGNSTGRDLRRYYGENADRILTIKRGRDPNNLFQHYLPSDSMANAPFDVREKSDSQQNLV